jgi:hypothetical protein
MRVAIIGGGAAGFFAAIHVKENFPKAEVLIFEKSKKVLSKVKISGGGRCNVTNGCTDIRELSEAYPRGGRQLRKLFGHFSTKETMAWFEARGVSLVIQEDNCVFPRSQNSQSIIDCLLKETVRLDIRVRTSCGIRALIPESNGQFTLVMDELPDECFDKVIVTTGGQPKRSGLEWLEKLGHTIEEPVPSLFTFNMPKEKVRELMGVVVENATSSIPGTKLKAQGPLLITHWGMSGPAILVLSAFGARILSEKDYCFPVSVNWLSIQNEEIVREELSAIVRDHGNKQLGNYRPYLLPERLWHYLLEKRGLLRTTTWNQLGKKGITQLITVLTNDQYQVEGKTTFKEEFVTCGGISFESIDVKTMQSKAVPGLYFAGEVVDVDGITGGYNFQAAWTTAFVAAKLA